MDKQFVGGNFINGTTLFLKAQNNMFDLEFITWSRGKKKAATN